MYRETCGVPRNGSPRRWSDMARKRRRMVGRSDSRTAAKSESKVLKGRTFRWDGVQVREYKPVGVAPYKDVTRQTLLGEGAGEESLNFITRYFEIQPGGYSTLEHHEHPHAVIVLRGRGRVLLGGCATELEPQDCVYVAPHEPHQFHAAGSEPLGFICIVDRERDRPVILGRSVSAEPRAAPRG
jgi:quercetin dioxygenase-like cupin family protein